MDDFIKQLSSTEMLGTYSKIWISLKERIGLLFNTKITMFKTELTGPVIFSIGLLILFLIAYWTKGRMKLIITQVISFKIAFAILMVVAKTALPYFE